jgi:hypothetical protein
MVADHDSTDARTHPGQRRLAALTGHNRKWVANHLRHLEKAGHIVLREQGAFRGGGDDRAAEYELPWLANRPPARTSVPSGGRERGREGGHIPIPIGIDTDDADASRNGGAVVGATDTGDASKPNVLPMAVASRGLAYIRNGDPKGMDRAIDEWHESATATGTGAP